MGRRKKSLPCPDCGSAMFYDNVDHYVCSDCEKAFIIDGSDLYPDDYYFLDHNFDDDDEGESGCAACGNPAYPSCKSSCPMFDD